jgi:putative FmdB family regulatory protein
MPTYTYWCSECQKISDAFYSLKETRPDQVQCNSCDKQANYQLAAPMVLKASYLDGQRGKHWKDLKEASKLNKAAAATDNQQEKQELQAEQKKIGYNFSKEPV